MPRDLDDIRTDCIEAVVSLARKRLPRERHETAERFIRQLYSQADAHDLAQRAPEDLYGAALSLWSFAERRKPGSPKLRAFQPNIEDHGWQSPHTVLEIVNDDMPFLVDSVAMAVNRAGLTLHLVIHPLVQVARDSAGKLKALLPDAGAEGLRESLMHVEVDRIVEPQLAAFVGEVERTLEQVRAAVKDWKPMLAKVGEVLDEIERRKPPVAPNDVSEARAFLEWLASNHFTFLGYRCHDLVRVKGEDVLQLVPGSGLGILRNESKEQVSASFAALPPKARAAARAPELLIVTKSNSRSTVHRPGYLDYVGVKRFDEKGEVCGEHRFLGLFTSTAYISLPRDIPLLRRKIAAVTGRAGLLPHSHAGKALENILNTYPRDELFQITADELLETALGIMQLGERQRFRLFVRRDPYERFVSCLLYAPREQFNTELRLKWQAILMESFNGTSSEFNVFLSESVLARILITVRTKPGSIPERDVRELESRIAAAARRWEDDLRVALVDAMGEAGGVARFREYGAAFPAAYREDFTARSAVPDVRIMAQLTDAEPLGLALYRPPEAAPGMLRFKLFHRGAPLALSDGLPMLEHMGLRVLEERPYRIQAEGGAVVWLHDFAVASSDEADLEIDALQSVFEDAFGRIFRGEVESDDFNRLVVGARLAAEEVVILRAYAKYLRQIGFAISTAFIRATLAAHPDLARMLVSLFRLRLDPRAADDEAAERQKRAIEEALDRVENLNEDRALRQYLALVEATLRTNYWKRGADGRPCPFLSFKFDPARVPGLPEPRPMFEIFVYSPRFEAVHLRGGKVARGGLRWSDRPEDFRTEILGLVKAQMVKNAVIVPVGSKGGFVLKRAPSPADREAFLKEGVACYQDFLRGMLDVTDNRVGEKIEPPADVRRRDGDDPYLVVAADKGTATFSDYANAISREYGFWLDDAYASGGSAGYDHKKMGITARGAWESVKRHFREMGVDTQTTDFTVVGIGDMSGDVFGNGMLLSRHIRLVAAFDHRHIFIDPDPNPATSFEERERLFGLPRSSWADYRTELISKGGGIWPRSAKSIPVSPEARRVLGIDAKALPPSELISAILRAPVDLIYNGGIGTYVKASDESHAEVGDRANDAVRVNGAELRCKAVGEGGNLGFTQLGRIEYAMAGGRINTDAIDNSAGVGTSDHEVNIKILLGLVIAEGELTEKQRNKLLAEMTDEVAKLVLRDNYFQTQSLSVSGRIAPQLLHAQARFIHFLEKAGRLNRAIEFLPSDDEIAERKTKGLGFTCPERAVLLAYSKIWLYDELLASDLPDDPWVATALERYFPRPLRSRYASYMPRHPLRREIIATHVTNSMVNRVGSTFVHRLMESTGAAPADIVRAYLLQREVFGLIPLWQEIEALDNKVADKVQADMLLDNGRLVVRGTTWFLRSRRLSGDMAATFAHFKPATEALEANLDSLLEAHARAQFEHRVEKLAEGGVPPPLARRVAAADALFAALDITEVATALERPVGAVARVYFELAGRLEFPWLREAIGKLPADAHWQTLAKAALRDDLSELQRALAAQVLGDADAATPPAEAISAWEARSAKPLERARQMLIEVKSAPAPDLAMLSVAVRELRSLV